MKKSPQWGIYKAIRELSSESHELAKESSPFSPTTLNVISILKIWAENWANDPKMQSLLSKGSFLHEMEESIVAIHFFEEWKKTSGFSGSVVAVDVCGGKGMFSLLLQYMNAIQKEREHSVILDHIILLEKATESSIDWSHLSKPPAQCLELVPVKIWQNCNLKELNNVTKRFRQVHFPLALTGIHLCKLLSPSLVSIVNQLGDEVQYLCLAPCCMPRAVTSKTLADEQRRIEIMKWENERDRKERMERNRIYDLTVRKKRSKGTCYLCNSGDHWLRDCPESPADAEAKKRMIEKLSACWLCGKLGHAQSACPVARDARPRRHLPPSISMDVSRVLKSTEPILHYAKLLGDEVEAHKVDVFDCPFEGSIAHSDRNWNAGRKSVFIVSQREM